MTAVPPSMPFEGRSPELGSNVFVAPTATLIGKVRLGARATVWYGAVLRGDVGEIAVGARTNVQDLAVLHMTGGISDVWVGEDVTIGHAAVLHGCRVGDRCLVGIGAIVLDGAEIGEESVVAAGSLIAPRTKIPARSFVLGRPAKVLRATTDEEARLGLEGARSYLELVERYRASGA